MILQTSIFNLYLKRLLPKYRSKIKKNIYNEKIFILNGEIMKCNYENNNYESILHCKNLSMLKIHNINNDFYQIFNFNKYSIWIIGLRY